MIECESTNRLGIEYQQFITVLFLSKICAVKEKKLPTNALIECLMEYKTW